MPVHVKPKTPWWFRPVAWICTRFGIVIWFWRDQPDHHWMLQLSKPRKEQP